MHHQRIRLGALEPFRRQAIKLVKFARGRNERAIHALILQTQHHDNIGAVERSVEIMEWRHPITLDFRPHQRGRRTNAHLSTECGQAKHVRARDTAVQDVTANGDDQPFERAFAAADGQCVQQSLRRVLMATVAGIEDGAIHPVGDQLHGARAHMADHDHIGAHRIQRHGRIDQRFALLHARLGSVHVHHVRAKALAGNLEGQQRARAVLEKGIDLGEAGEAAIMLAAVRPVEGNPLFRLIEEETDFMRRERGDPGQVPVREEGWRCH